MQIVLFLIIGIPLIVFVLPFLLAVGYLLFQIFLWLLIVVIFLAFVVGIFKAIFK